MYVRKNTFMYVIMYIRTHVRRCLCTNVRIFVYTYVYICMHLFIINLLRVFCHYSIDVLSISVLFYLFYLI